MKLELETTNVFQRHQVYYDRLKSQGVDIPIIAHEGGTRSSKTRSIIQKWGLDSYKATNPLEFTIVRAKMTWLRLTVLRDFGWFVSEYGIPINPQFNHRRAEQEYEVFNCNWTFMGMDETLKFHGRQQWGLWINEAIECYKKDFTQFEMRTEGEIVLDYNPTTLEHWVYDLEKREECEVIRSTQLDNPFLPAGIRNRILSLEPTIENMARGTADKYNWQVYGLGMRAAQKGRIYKKVTYVNEFPIDCKWVIYGLDFGFTNAPTALVKIGLHDGALYVQELLYEKGLTNVPGEGDTERNNISDRLEDLGIDKKKDEIIADSAEPKSIKELRKEGWNIKPCEKGPDSIKNGIDAVNRYPLRCVLPSINMAKEFTNYKYVEDASGKLTNKPIKRYNHCMDGIRYGSSKRIKVKKKQFRVTI